MSQDDNFGKFEKNLITLLRLFHNRPMHLAKYLIENDSFNDDFKKSISNSTKLEDTRDRYEFSDLPNVYFLNFRDMLRYFDSISKEFNIGNLDSEKMVNDLNVKLDELIKSEKYEEAIKVRDFMIQNNIRRKN
jgi:hypothetical protein